jgi:hypothetical protein
MHINWDLEAERDLWTSICAPNSWHGPDGESVGTHTKSLWYFIHYGWGAEMYFRNHPEKPRWLIERVHGPYIAWLQEQVLEWKAARRRGSRERFYIAVVIPRAFGKTVTSTKCTLLWSHLDEPDMSTLICSATHPLAKDILGSVENVISGKDSESWFAWMYGVWFNPDREWSETAAVHGYRRSTNLSEPSFDTTGVGIGMTGYHHDQHCWDDPIIINKDRPGGVYMDGVHQAVDASFNALQPNGLLMFTLTRYGDDDICGRHLRNEGIKTWTGMECPNITLSEKVPFGKGAWRVYFLQAEDELTGKAILPEVYDEKKIAEHKRRDPEDFACQYQNNPGTGEHSPLVEKQLYEMFMDYEQFRHNVPVEGASVHIDTAFKRLENVRKGDDTAILVAFHDARPNGLVYIDTDKLVASNELRAEDFDDRLIDVFLKLRARQYHVKALTDEAEMGGKAGIFKNHLVATLRGAGIRVPRILQFNRSGTIKRARIRTSAGFWAEGFVRILLHRDKDGAWIIPPVVKKFFNQMLRIDAVAHDDIADAQADIWTEGVWRRPTSPEGMAGDEGSVPRGPGDSNLKAMSRPLTQAELREMMDERAQEEAQLLGPGHGADDDWMPPREFV